MSPLELRRKQIELDRVKLARSELELKIEEKTEEINRLREHIKIQEAKERDLSNEINNLSKQ